MINPDFLKTFVSLARTKHFTQTAKLLHMTQPGVSQHLKRLEEYFEVVLLERLGSEIILSEAGRILQVYAEKLEHEHFGLLEQLKVDHPHQGKVRMSAPGGLGLMIFDVLVNCGLKHPKLQVELVVAPRANIEQRVLDDEVDVGFGALESLDSRIDCEHFYDEELCVVAPASSRGKTFENFQKLGIVWHPDLPFLLDRVFAPNFKQYRGVSDFQIRCSINQFNRIIDPIAAGLGFSILPKIAFSYFSKEKSVRAVGLPHIIKERIFKMELKRSKKAARVQYVQSEIQKALKKYR